MESYQRYIDIDPPAYHTVVINDYEVSPYCYGEGSNNTEAFNNLIADLYMKGENATNYQLVKKNKNYYLHYEKNGATKSAFMSYDGGRYLLCFCFTPTITMYVNYPLQ